MLSKRLTVLGVVIFVVCIVSLQVWLSISLEPISCSDSTKQQMVASQELSRLFQEDMHEREHWEKLSHQQMEQMKLRDRERRIRVSELFADGCFKSSNDYSNAALIFQHGDTRDHYYQTFIWSKRAVELGDEQQKTMMALSIDRYLVSMGQKQLFGSQWFASEKTNWCFCMQQVETNFPDLLRQQYLGESLEEKYKQIASYNESKQNCKLLDCPHSLKPSPQGTIPGFW